MSLLRVCAVIAAWWVTCALGTAAAQSEPSAPTAVVSLHGPLASPPSHVVPTPAPLVPVSLDRLVLYAFVGEVVGAGIGAVLAMVASVALCHGNEGWLTGFTCGAGIGYAASMGAFVGAAVGAPASVAAAGARRHADGDGWAGLGGSALSLGAGVGIFGLIEASTDQPTLATAVGGVLSIVLGLVLPPVFYDLGRPRRAAPTVAIRGLGLAVTW